MEAQVSKVMDRDVQILEMRYGLGYSVKYLMSFFNMSKGGIERILRKYKPPIKNPTILVLDSKINGDN